MGHSESEGEMREEYNIFLSLALITSIYLYTSQNRHDLRLNLITIFHQKEGRKDGKGAGSYVLVRLHPFIS